MNNIFWELRMIMVGILQCKNTILKPFILAYAKVVGCALQFHRIEVYLKAIGM